MLEHFPSSQRLYQYLNWTVRISKVAATTAAFESQRGDKVLLINTELHCKMTRQELYALCIPNDVTNPKVQEWQFAVLKTGDELVTMLGILPKELPKGVRAISQQFNHYRQLKSDPNGEGLANYKKVCFTMFAN